jgi:Fic family protein
MAASDSPSVPKGYKWKEISDLPSDLESLRDRELESLSQVWADQRTTVEDEERIIAFNQELAREWAIETGIIEGVYTLDRGITETLIEHGIDSSYISHDSTNRDPELVARIMQAHQAVLEGLFAFVKGERELGTSYIKELHAALLQHQDAVVVWDQFGKPFEKKLEKGAYKTQANNPRREDGTIHEYCPPEHVASEMDRLIELHRQHRSRGVAAHIEAAWLHHAFTQVHPFQDGNGRVARSLASLVFIRGGFFPLVVTRDDRAKYIELLELADEGDLPNLVGLFSQLQKRALRRAIARAMDTKPVKSRQEALDLTRDMLVNVGKAIRPEYYVAKQSADRIYDATLRVHDDTIAKLSADLARINREFQFSRSTIGEGALHQLQSQAVEANRAEGKLGYEPNTTDYFESSVINLTTSGITSRITVILTSVGVTFKGVIAVLASFQTETGPIVSLFEEIFWIKYREPVEEVQKRYAKWLDDVMIRGLAEWRRTLV